MIKQLFVFACISFIIFIVWLFLPAIDLGSESRLIKWEKLSLRMPDRELSDPVFAVADKRFFVFNGENFFYTDDFDKWVEIKESPEFRGFHRDEPFALAWFKNRLWAFFAKKEQAVWSSKDGKNWKLEAEKINSSGHCYGKVCVFKDQLWLVNSMGEGTVYNSADGKTWKEVGHSGYSGGYVHNLFVFRNELWLTGLDWGDFWKSADGISWKKVKLNFPGVFRNNACFGVFDDKLWLIGGRREYSLRETIKADPFFFLFFLNVQGSSKKMKDVSDTWYSEDGQSWVCNSKKEAINFIDIKAFSPGDRFILTGDAGNFSYNSARSLTRDKYLWIARPVKP